MSDDDPIEEVRSRRVDDMRHLLDHTTARRLQREEEAANEFGALATEDVDEESEEVAILRAQAAADAEPGSAAPPYPDDDEPGEPAPMPDARARWLVLFLYAYLSALQSLLWMTFSSVPDISRAYLGVDDSTLDLWLDWGPAAFLVSVFVAGHLMATQRAGLAQCIRAGAVLCFIAAVLRCVPVLFNEEDILGGDNSALVVLIHVCQFVNGAAAPFVVASPALLSLVWFPEGQRNAVTAAANVANALGRGVGFFLGPALVKSTTDMPTLLLLEAVLAALSVVVALLCMPSLPQAPPSRAAREEELRWNRIERARRRRERRERVKEADRAVEAELREDEALDAAEEREEIEAECSRIWTDVEAAEAAEGAAAGADGVGEGDARAALLVDSDEAADGEYSGSLNAEPRHES